MIILGVDVETTGLDSTTDEIVEMGCVLYDTSSDRVIATFGKVYRVDTWGEEAAECHLIPKEVSDIMPSAKGDADPWDVISGGMAKYVVAHNAPHDYAFVTKMWPSFKNRPWLCTQRDINHRSKLKSVTSYRLGHLCVDYHIQMGSWHQAVADAEACARIAAIYDLDEAYERKIKPKFRLAAYGKWMSNIKELLNEAPSVLLDGRRYRWNTDDAPRAWSKEDLTIEEFEADAKYIKDVTDGWKFDGFPLDSKSY